MQGSLISTTTLGTRACMRNSSICTAHRMDDDFHRWRARADPESSAAAMWQTSVPRTRPARTIAESGQSLKAKMWPEPQIPIVRLRATDEDDAHAARCIGAVTTTRRLN